MMLWNSPISWSPSIINIWIIANAGFTEYGVGNIEGARLPNLNLGNEVPGSDASH